jgi:hypothetical protein
VDPATGTALVTLIGLLYQYGPWGVAVVVIYGVIRVWRSGEFLPKSTHDQIVATTKVRYEDMLERYKASQDGLLAWRQTAERATSAAEESQKRHQELLSGFTALRSELAAALAASIAKTEGETQSIREELLENRAILDSLREDFHSARVWGQMGQPPPGGWNEANRVDIPPAPQGPTSRPPPRRRPPAREGG